jgi:hypothetical protein
MRVFVRRETKVTFHFFGVSEQLAAAAFFRVVKEDFWVTLNMEVTGFST